jgi:hypothetical protein
VSGYYDVFAAWNGVYEPPVAEVELFAECPPGKVVLGGGFSQSGGVEILRSSPGAGVGGWLVIARTADGEPGHFTLNAWALCATAG